MVLAGPRGEERLDDGVVARLVEVALREPGEDDFARAQWPELFADAAEERPARKTLPASAEQEKADEGALSLAGVEAMMGRTGRPAAARQAYSMSAVDEYGPVIDDIYDFAEAQGFEIDGITQEGGEVRLVHLAEDVNQADASRFQRLAQHGEGDALDLDVHLKSGDAVAVARHLEVHVSQGVLASEDVGEDHGSFARGLVAEDETHGDARDFPANRSRTSIRGLVRERED